MEIPRRREEFGARREHYKQLELLFTVSIFYWVIGRNKAIEKIPHHPANSLPGPDTVDIILTPPRTVNVQRYSYFTPMTWWQTNRYDGHIFCDMRIQEEQNLDARLFCLIWSIVTMMNKSVF